MKNTPRLYLKNPIILHKQSFFTLFVDKINMKNRVSYFVKTSVHIQRINSSGGLRGEK